MSISSVSSSLTSAYSTVSSNNDDTAQLEKQKTTLESELQKVNQSKDDEKTKQQKIKELQSQMQQIDAEIQQKKSSKTTQKQNNIQQTIAVNSNGSNINSKDAANKISNSADSAKVSSDNNMIDTWD